MHTITLKKKTTERQRGKGLTHSGMATLHQQGFAGTHALSKACKPAQSLYSHEGVC